MEVIDIQLLKKAFMKNLTLILILSIMASVAIFAHPLPDKKIKTNDDFPKSEEEFRKTEKKVIENILYLEQNPSDNLSDEDKKKVSFVLRWAVKCPYITVNLYGDVKQFAETSSDSSFKYSDYLIVSYLFGKILATIEFQDKEHTEYDDIHRGIVGMINAYNSFCRLNPGDCGNEVMEKYKKLHENGELMDYITEKYKPDEEENLVE